MLMNYDPPHLAACVETILCKTGNDFSAYTTLQRPLENVGLLTPTQTLRLIVWHTDCVLKDDLREVLNSSNKTFTIVYKQDMLEVARPSRTVHWPKPHTTRLILQWLRLQARTWTLGDSRLQLHTPHVWREKYCNIWNHLGTDGECVGCKDGWTDIAMASTVLQYIVRLSFAVYSSNI